MSLLSSSLSLVCNAMARLDWELRPHYGRSAVSPCWKGGLAIHTCFEHPTHHLLLASSGVPLWQCNAMQCNASRVYTRPKLQQSRAVFRGSTYVTPTVIRGLWGGYTLSSESGLRRQLDAATNYVTQLEATEVGSRNTAFPVEYISYTSEQASLPRSNSFCDTLIISNFSFAACNAPEAATDVTSPNNLI